MVIEPSPYAWQLLDDKRLTFLGRNITITYDHN